MYLALIANAQLCSGKSRRNFLGAFAKAHHNKPTNENPVDFQSPNSISLWNRRYDAS